MIYTIHCSTQCSTHCSTLRRTATHCNALQHTATHCNTLQHTAIHCNTLQHTATTYRDVTVHDTGVCFDVAARGSLYLSPSLFLFLSLSPLFSAFCDACVCLDTATHCNTLQHTATHCNTLQHTATTSRGVTVHDTRVRFDVAACVATQ